MKPWHVRLPRWALPVCVISYCLFAFAPYDFNLPVTYEANHAVRSAGGELRFSAPGFALSDGAPPWISHVRENDSVTVSLRVTSYGREQGGPARIFTLSSDTLHRNLTIAQEGEELIVRLRSPFTNENGMPSYSVPDVFALPRSVAIVVDVEPHALVVLVDGTKVIEERLPSGALADWNEEQVLVLGNEYTLDRPWLGALHEVEVSSADEILFRLSDPLLVPKGHWQLSKRMRDIVSHQMVSIHDWQRPGSWLDKMKNLLGFIPFGMLIAWRSGGISITKAVALVAAMSLTIEIGQLFFDYRHPTLSDLTMQMAGGVLGGWLGNRYARQQRASESTETPRVP